MYVNAGKLLQFQLKFEPTLTWKLVELVGWWSLIAKVIEVLTLHISIA